MRAKPKPESKEVLDARGEERALVIAVAAAKAGKVPPLGKLSDKAWVEGYIAGRKDAAGNVRALLDGEVTDAFIRLEAKWQLEEHDLWCHCCMNAKALKAEQHRCPRALEMKRLMDA